MQNSHKNMPAISPFACLHPDPFSQARSYFSFDFKVQIFFFMRGLIRGQKCDLQEGHPALKIFLNNFLSQSMIFILHVLN